MHITTQALVLREVNYKEADKILTVLTPGEGKRRVKARGCRRNGSRRAAGSQLLVYSDMTLFEYRGFFVLDEAASLQQFRGVRSDIEKLALGSYFAQVMETVAEEGRGDPALLSLILNSLYALDQLSRPQAQVKAAFELKLMCLAGYEPLLDACAVCGAPEPREPCLSLPDGVLCCAACRGGAGGPFVPLSGGTLAAMRHVVYGSPKRLFSFPADGVVLDCMGRVCEAFLTTQLGQDFRTLEFYHHLSSGGPSGSPHSINQ